LPELACACHSGTRSSAAGGSARPRDSGRALESLDLQHDAKRPALESGRAHLGRAEAVEQRGQCVREDNRATARSAFSGLRIGTLHRCPLGAASVQRSL
jgi:hypothetical protein